jgi:hypothetical protein
MPALFFKQGAVADKFAPECTAVARLAGPTRRRGFDLPFLARLGVRGTGAHTFQRSVFGKKTLSSPSYDDVPHAGLCAV